MKRLLLILSPYLLFCFILSTLLFLRPRKIQTQDKVTSSDTTQVSNSGVQDTTSLSTDESSTETPDNEPSEPIDENSDVIPVEDDTQNATTQDTDVQKNSVIIVVGSFKKETTATQLCDKLKPAGFNSRVEKKDGLYRVIAGDYLTEVVAQKDFNTLKDIGFEPWISDK